MATQEKTKKAADKPRALENDGKAAGKGKGGKVTVHGGTTTGYQRGCRCDECKAAMTAYTIARREAKKEADGEADAAKVEKAAKAKARREAKKAEAAAAA